MSRTAIRALSILGPFMLAAPSLLAQGAGFAIRDGDYLSAITVPADPDMKQAPSMKGCDRSKQAIGSIYGSGVVSYLVTVGGRADTSTIQVVSHEGMSSGSLASIAHRVLVTCSYHPAESAAGRAPALVDQKFTFQSGTPHTEGTVVAAGSAGTADPVDVHHVDEVPSRLSCEMPWRFAGAGSFWFEFVIGTDGRAEPGSIKAVEAAPPTPEQFREAKEWTLSCWFSPGRIDGVPVRTLVRQSIISRGVHSGQP
ncbi:MAG TPA: hypothetical protein VJN95_12705 [Gemmatimonadales bacterium]|nr:hypothetical protein [Gemmatimonadales bacterium]